MLVLAIAMTANAQAPLARTGALGGHNLPPAQMLMEPGPGVGGPGPGVLLASPSAGAQSGGPAEGFGPFGAVRLQACLLYTSPSPRDRTRSRMPSSA